VNGERHRRRHELGGISAKGPNPPPSRRSPPRRRSRSVADRRRCCGSGTAAPASRPHRVSTPLVIPPFIRYARHGFRHASDCPPAISDGALTLRPRVPATARSALDTSARVELSGRRRKCPTRASCAEGSPWPIGRSRESLSSLRLCSPPSGPSSSLSSVGRRGRDRGRAAARALGRGDCVRASALFGSVSSERAEKAGGAREYGTRERPRPRRSRPGARSGSGAEVRWHLESLGAGQQLTRPRASRPGTRLAKRLP
jgi:hypothetical protein